MEEEKSAHQIQLDRPTTWLGAYLHRRDASESFPPPSMHLWLHILHSAFLAAMQLFVIQVNHFASQQSVVLQILVACITPKAPILASIHNAENYGRLILLHYFPQFLHKCFV